MKLSTLSVTFAAIGMLASASVAQQQRPRSSPPAETSVTIGGKAVSIKYSAPSMKDRKIFGGLVPFDKVWRAGANEATALHTEADLAFGKLTVPKGDYTLYVLPGAKQWKLIINKQTGQWGTEYDESKDLGRVNVKLKKAAAPVETWKMTLSAQGNKGGTLQMEWENTVGTVSFKVK